MDKISILRQEGDEVEFEYQSNDITEVNNLRRKFLSKVKTYAIDEIIIHNNTTDLPDEVVCLRLGLLVLTFSAVMRNSYHFEFTNLNQTVTTSMIEDMIFNHGTFESTSSIKSDSGDSDIITDPIKEDGPIGNEKIGKEKDFTFIYETDLIRMYPGQELSITFNVKEDNGKTHAKWSPCSTVAFRSHDDKYLFNLCLTGALSFEQILQQVF